MDEETAELESILREDRGFEALELPMNRQVIMNEETQKIVRQVSSGQDRRNPTC